MECYFILNKGANKKNAKISCAVLQGQLVANPKGWDAFFSWDAAYKKMNEVTIQQQAQLMGFELEIVRYI